VIIRFALLVRYRLVTDGQIDRNTKVEPKCRKWGGWGGWESRKVTGNCTIQYSTYEVLGLHGNYVIHLFWYIARLWSKIAIFNLLNLYLASPLAVIPFEFRQDFCSQKTSVLGYCEALFAWSQV